MAYTYPPPAPTISRRHHLTIHRFLRQPDAGRPPAPWAARAALHLRRAAQGPLQVPVAAVTSTRPASRSAPGRTRARSRPAEYPLVQLGHRHGVAREDGQVGPGRRVYRRGDQASPDGPGQPGFSKLANQNVGYVDSVALSAIASAVTRPPTRRRRLVHRDGRADPPGRRAREGEHHRAQRGLRPGHRRRRRRQLGLRHVRSPRPATCRARLMTATRS
jgi:hypothetical protein